ncbi:MAG: hypothetical protein SNJ55_07300 [Chloroherpetonaceae bacterium]
MSKIEKKLERWKTAKQPVSISEVEPVIKRFFPNVRILEGSSHRYMISHSALKEDKNFAPNGTLLIPVKGNQIKAKYIQQLVKAITLCQNEQTNKQ